MGLINRRDFLRQSATGVVGLGLLQAGCRLEGTKRPNFIIIFCDDMGYGDWGHAGNPTISTPNLNRMAEEGVVMTQFYSAASVCSPSRAALLTGRYPIRNGMVRVLFPYDNRGIPESELTLAALLKKRGYTTAAIGKWHLGHLQPYLPTSKGFDSYFGIPYSNDMDRSYFGQPAVPIPLMRNEEIIEQPCDQATVTKRYTEEAVKFIQEQKSSPFFLYLAHTMPHVPLYVSDAFRGKSRRGLYGDVIEEIDWSVGQILQTLRDLGLDKDTLVFFTSDNGPWMTTKQHGGTAGQFRGAKGSTWEGGVREPFIAWCPGKLPASKVTAEIGTTMDLFTTCLTLAGASIPTDRPIDGKNIYPVFQGLKPSPHETIYYYWSNELVAIRYKNYKLHFKTNDSVIRYQNWAVCETPELYDIEVDPSERFNLAADLPQVVADLMQRADAFKAEIESRNENADFIQALSDRWIELEQQARVIKK